MVHFPLFSYSTCLHDQWLQSCPTLCSPGNCTPRLLCPWDFPGKNAGVGGQTLLQGIFPTQGSNLRLFNAGGFFTTEPLRRPFSCSKQWLGSQFWSMRWRGTSRKSLRSWIKRVVLPLIPAWSWDMKPGSSAAMLWAWSDLREDETLHITGGGQTGRDVWIPSDIAEWPHKPCTAHLYCSSVHGDSSGKNPGVGCHVLLQGNLSNPGTEPRSPALHSLLSEPPGKPKLLIRWIN